MQQINIKIKLVIFSILSEELVIYFRDNSLPTENIGQKILLDEQIKNLFKKSLNIDPADNFIEQLYTVANNKNEINIIYYALLFNDKQLGSSNWKFIKNLNKKDKDYNIISYAIQRLQWKVEYTNVVYSLLPREFTLGDLQKTYEIVLNKKLDKRNFRKKISSLNFLKTTGKKHIGAARPAQTYSFKEKNPTIIKIF